MIAALATVLALNTSSNFLLVDLFSWRNFGGRTWVMVRSMPDVGDRHAFLMWKFRWVSVLVRLGRFSLLRQQSPFGPPMPCTAGSSRQFSNPLSCYFRDKTI